MSISRATGVITRAAVGAVLAALTITPALRAQQPAPVVVRLVAEPAKIAMAAGDSIPFKVIGYDAQGNAVANPVVRVGGPRRSIFFGDGYVKAFEAGTFKATASAFAAAGGTPVTLEIPDLGPTWGMEVKYRIKGADGRLVTGVIHNTIHAFGK